MFIISSVLLLASVAWWLYKNKPVASLKEDLNDISEANDSLNGELIGLQRKVNEIDMVNSTIMTADLVVKNQQEKKQLLKEIRELEATYNRLVGPYNDKKRIEEEIARARRRAAEAAALSARRSSSSYSSSSSRGWGGGGGGFSGGGASGGW